MAIISKHVTPPNGWLFEGLGITIRGTSFDDLVHLIRAHCINNKLKLDKSYDQIVTDYFLAKFPGMEIKSDSVMAPSDTSGLYRPPPPVEDPKPKFVPPQGVMAFSPTIPPAVPGTPIVNPNPSKINIQPIIPQNVPEANPLAAHKPAEHPAPIETVKKKRGRPKKVEA